MINRIRKTGKLIICILTIAVMLIPGIASGGSVDRMIHLLTHGTEESLDIHVQVETVHMPELSETRTEWLNRLLSHVTIRLRMNGDMQEETIEVDGTEALRCTSRNGENGTQTVFSVDESKAYFTATQTDLLGEISGIASEENRAEYYSRIAVLLPEFYTFFSGLTDVFPEASSVAKANVKFKNYGTATKRWSISLDDEVLQSEKMQRYLSQDGMENVRVFLSGVVLNGRQRLTLLTDDEGRLMKVNYTGKAGLSHDDMRSVNLDWRCMRNETGERDELQLTTPMVHGSGKNNITIQQEITTSEDGIQHYTCNAETDQVIDRVRTRYILDISLSGTENRIGGEIREKTIAGSSISLLSILLDLSENANNEHIGTLEIIREMDKIEKEHYRLQIRAGTGGEIPWNVETVNELTEDEKSELADRLTNAFLRTLIPVPEEDLMYILADLPDGWWAELIRKTEKTEEIPQP